MSMVRRKKIVSVFAVAILAMTILFGMFLAYADKDAAHALSDVSGAYQIGEKGDGTQLTSIYDDTKGKFDANMLHELFAKTTDNTNATIDSVKDYIKANGFNDYNTYGKSSPASAASDPYYVVPASTINANGGKADYGIVLQLGGYTWTVASLTLDNSNNVVATLYSESNIGTSRYYANSDGSKGSNMYSRSTVRSQLLSNANWSYFSGGDFAASYLVQPKNIKYQHTETVTSRQSGLNNCPNDALDALPSGWNAAVTYDPSDA